MNEMAHIYLRPDVANTVTIIYKKVNYWCDSNFPVHAVNAYRDLFCGALANVVNAAVDGDTGETLSKVARDECSPNSDVYITTITNRQNRVDDGRSWLIANARQPPSNKSDNGNGNLNGNSSSSSEKAKSPVKRGMPDAQKALVPIVDGRSICLANLSVRGCKRPDNCKYSHETSKPVPLALETFFKNRFGAKK